MKIKNVVKVMNFHSLLRVDSAKRNAEKYLALEAEASSMIDNIYNNRNFILDKRALKPKDSMPVLNIYIGSDFGFCSNFNSQVNEILLKDEEADKVVIGKKLRRVEDRVLLQVNKEELDKNIRLLEDIVEDSILNLKHREINIIYDHYENAGNIYLEKKTVFPVKLEDKDPADYTDDFVIETDVNELLRGLLILYINYEIRICLINANAAENVLRQNTTSESLKKIDEREEVELKRSRKEKRAKEFRKVIENFAKIRNT